MGKFNIRTIFAYDWPLTLAGMEHIAGDVCAIDLVGVCRTPDELVATLDTLDCDIALVDYSVRGDARMNGFALCEWLRRMRPNVGIVALVGNENPVIFRSILSQVGASLVSKFDEVGHIVTAIHSSYSGGHYLSPLVRRALDALAGHDTPPVKLSTREIEVIRLYLAGMPIKAIAQRLNKGKQTVSAQKISAMKKLGASNDIELVQRAAALGLDGGKVAGCPDGAEQAGSREQESRALFR
ncbi:MULTISPECIES: response regulator transcription factor [unclassified Burkholderia]|uniref:response regulator transcription factor n=1 Tax=unclassified Burkholderia TaxID=2613784 RepID=UPI000F5B677F|nr:MULTISPECIES: response regulator transcription factor [unclassified Burkholderia]RQS53198.1 DNA-binding response regulator [Burkholderia sp. Bp8986]RQZ48076.1 DNA-binding response regulator [Burkholderia sp. Bp9099]